MNKDQIYGVLRMSGAMLMTYLVTSGKLTSDQASVLVNAATQALPILTALALAVYSAYTRRDAAKALGADKLQGVTVTVDKFSASPAVVEAAQSTNTIRIKG